MNKFSDIRDDLEENINIKKDYILKKIGISYMGKKNLIDISKNKNTKKIDLSNDKKIVIQKNRTKKFDSFFKGKKQNINIKDTKKNYKYFLNKIRLFFKKYYLLFILKNEENFLIKKLKPQNKKIITENKNIFDNKIQKKILLFLFFVFVIFFANKIFIENLVSYGYEKIISIRNNAGGIEKISNNINKSNLSLNIANVFFSPLSIFPNENIKNVNNIIKGGKNLSGFLKDSIELFYSFEKLKENKKINELNIVDFLEQSRPQIMKIHKKLYSSLFYYYNVGDLGDNNLNEKLEYGKSLLSEFYSKLDIVTKNYNTLLSMVGKNTTRKYFVVFQNNDEIRPTGGFMGSTATITIKNGKIIDVENSDIYAHEWDINKVYTDKIKAPEGLDKITGTFGLRDANYFPEFKNSSTNIKSFLDMIDYNIDGIIYINQNFILDLLETTGNINSETLGLNINKDNFSLVISTLVEAKVFKVGTLGTPKQVLFDFAGEFYKKLLEKGDYYSYGKILLKHINSRDIVFYSFRPEENSLLWKLGLNGEMNFNKTLDFNYPVFTSIGGNKTDRYIDYNIDKVVQSIPDSCDFTTSLKISKTHNFTTEDDEKVNLLLDQYGVTDKTDILNIQGRGDNKSYLRILLPKNIETNLQDGQTLIESEKYNIIELYTYARMRETGVDQINYRINNPNCLEYDFNYFKQPGIKNYDISFDILGNFEEYTNLETDFIYKR